MLNASAVRSTKAMMSVGYRQALARERADDGQPKRYNYHFGRSGSLQRCPKVSCHDRKDGDPRMEDEVMKATLGSLDRDLAFEAADFMIEEASINDHALI